MKKFFTLFALVAMCAASSFAQEEFTVKMNNLDYYTGEVASDPYYAEMTYENGVYTVVDFMDSGCSFSFTLPENPEAGKSYEIAFQKNEFDVGGDYWWLVEPEEYEAAGVSPEGYSNYENGIWLTNYLDSGDDQYGWYPTIYNVFYDAEYDYYYTYAYYYGEDAAKPWYIGITYDVMVEDEDGNYPWTWFYLWFDMPAFETSGVAVNEVDAAPEYFNLQGVKVANPEKGLFIKKVAGKAQKVMM